MKRIQTKQILKDLQKKMVFLVGPRQIGKTWLAKEVSKLFKKPLYLNYDNLKDRKIIKNEAWLTSTDLIIFDEIHKMPKFKNYLKGIFDTKNNNLQILITGSARLDTFRKSGDSLAGRFFKHRLLPFTPSELIKIGEKYDIDKLIDLGGFPEPFLAEDINTANRWRTEYIDGLIRKDVLDFEKIHDFKAIQLLLDLLRYRVGSPISYTSLAEDIGVSVNTVKKYIEIFESLYIIFKITPFSRKIARSILKEPKIYFFDNGMVIGNDGAKLENFVAISLLKYVYCKRDYEGTNINLHYMRTKDQKEIDFSIASFDKVEMNIEVKLSDNELSKNLLYFKEKYHIPSVQLVKNLRNEKIQKEIEIRKIDTFLSELEY
jgi:hypothetical protein